MLEHDVPTRRALSPRNRLGAELIAAIACFERRPPGRLGALACFLVTGGLAGLALVVTEALALRSWTLFLVWVGYGVLGGNLRAGAQLLAAFVVGAGAGCATVLVGIFCHPWLGGAALPIALGLSCGLLAALEKWPPFDVVPGYFIGMIAFFASGEAPSVGLLGDLTAPAALGVAWGWADVRLRQTLEVRLEVRRRLAP